MNLPPIPLTQLDAAHSIACDLAVWINSLKLWTRTSWRRALLEPQVVSAAGKILSHYDQKLEEAQSISAIEKYLSNEVVEVGGQPATSYHQAVYLLAVAIRLAIDEALHDAVMDAELAGLEVKTPSDKTLHQWTANSWVEMQQALKAAPVLDLPGVVAHLKMERNNYAKQIDTELNGHEWIPASKAVDRAAKIQFIITLKWLTKNASKHGILVRNTTPPARCKVEVEWNSLTKYLLNKRQREAETSNDTDTPTATQQAEIERNKQEAREARGRRGY